MKYADKLEILKIKSWDDKYIDYKLLKKILKKERSSKILSIYNRIDENEDIRNLCNSTTIASSTKDICLEEVKRKDKNEKEAEIRKDIRIDNTTKESGLKEDIDFNYLFFFVLENYVSIVKEHYRSEHNYLDKKLNEIISFLNKNTISDKDAFILKKNCLSIYNMFDVLNNYLNINILSTYKILKKKNKKEKNSDVLKLYKTYYFRLSEISKEDTFNEKIKLTFLSIQKKMGINCEKLDLINFKIYVKNQIGAFSIFKGTTFFICGMLITLIINMIILLYLKVNTQNVNTIMSVLPIYRLIYILNFFGLFIFGALFVMQTYGVNFTYILDLSKIVIEEYYYVFHYMILYLFMTTISLMMFVIDVLFQLNIFKNLFSHVLVLLAILFFMARFSFNSMNTKKENVIWKSFIRVVMSGLLLVENVNLMDNIIGDVLTSLSKTFSDFQYFICFLINKMNTDKPAKCPMMEKYVNPFFLGLPFYLRLCQCLIRYKKEKVVVHLYNMLKYMSGILIVLCTSCNWKYFGVSIYTSKLILVSAYVIGSTFMYIWDIYMDWGLLKEYDQLLREDNNIMYPPYYYYLGGIFNLIFRLTWAITIMPLSIFENQELNSFLITFFLMFIEVLRRSIWICFRLENEHITNASKYRAILWVPKLYKT